MARVKRDNDYVDLVEHVLGGVQVTPPRTRRARTSRLDATRRSWTRGLNSSEKEVVVAIADRADDRK